MDSDLLSAFISGGPADKSGQLNAAESRENMHGIVKSPTSSSLHSTASRKLLMAGDGVIKICLFAMNRTNIHYTSIIISVISSLEFYSIF